MTGADAAATAPPRPRAHRDRVLPDQHGAWAFLVLPVALAVTVTGWFALLPLLALAWVTAYPVSWAAIGRLTARRPERFDRALVVWTPLLLVTGAPVLLARLWLVWVLAAYAGLWLVNLWFAASRQERSLPNDLVLVAECALMVPVTLGAAAPASGWVPPYDAMAGAWLPVTACAVALTGSVLHVKSLIRERHDRRYAVASRAFALAGVPTVALVAAAQGGARSALWAGLPFALLAARAWLVPDRGWRPARIGVVEMVGLALVVAGVAAA